MNTVDFKAIEAQLASHFPDSDVTFDGDGYQFHVRVISTQFEGARKVQRHQQVYAVLNDLITSGEVHALNIETFTPTEWEQANG